MDVWNWLLLAAVVVLVVLVWHIILELHQTRQRVTELMHRLKRLRRLIMLDRLAHLEQELHEVEELIVRRSSALADGHGLHGVASYVATCRSFAQRSVQEGRSREQIDAVIRMVFLQLVREDAGHYAQLAQVLSEDERARWLGPSLKPD